MARRKKKIIHVNQHVIKANTKNGTNEPPLTVKTYNEGWNAQEVDILGPDGTVVATIIHRPHAPLSCGARVWIETHGDVVLRGQASHGPQACAV
jgi:hypothetical protein